MEARWVLGDEEPFTKGSGGEGVARTCDERRAMRPLSEGKPL